MNTPTKPEAVLALDMGGTHLRRALARRPSDLTQPLQTGRERSDPAHPSQQLERVVWEAHQTAGALRHVVIGLPGVVHNGQIYDAPNLLPLQDAKTLETLRQALPCPVTFMNDCNLAALGEQADDLAFIAIGTGLGCGLVRGGQVMPGEHGQAGEFGLLPMPDGSVLEDLLSGPGIQKKYSEYGGVGDALSFSGSAGTQLRQDIQAALVYLLHILTLSFDPRKIVFGGGMGLQLGELIDAAWQEVKERVSHVPRPTLSQYGDNAALVGGLRLGLEKAGEQNG